MKKFTGGLGDDDDRESGDDLVWQKYFTKVIHTVQLLNKPVYANGLNVVFDVVSKNVFLKS